MTRVKIIVPNTFIDKMEEHVSDVGENSAEEIQDISQDLAPINSGKLRNSIKVIKDGDSYKIIADVPYSSFVEFGTKDQAAQPFLRPALERVIRESD